MNMNILKICRNSATKKHVQLCLSKHFPNLYSLKFPWNIIWDQCSRMSWPVAPWDRSSWSTMSWKHSTRAIIITPSILSQPGLRKAFSSENFGRAWVPMLALHTPRPRLSFLSPLWLFYQQLDVWPWSNLKMSHSVLIPKPESKTFCLDFWKISGNFPYKWSLNKQWIINIHYGQERLGNNRTDTCCPYDLSSKGKLNWVKSVPTVYYSMFLWGMRNLEITKQTANETAVQSSHTTNRKLNSSWPNTASSSQSIKLGQEARKWPFYRYLPFHPTKGLQTF